MLDAKEYETDRQKERISRKPDQRRVNGAVGRQSIDMVLQPVLGDVAIDQRIAIDLRVGMNEPQPQRSAPAASARKIEIQGKTRLGRIIANHSSGPKR